MQKTAASNELPVNCGSSLLEQHSETQGAIGFIIIEKGFFQKSSITLSPAYAIAAGPTQPLLSASYTIIGNNELQTMSCINSKCILFLTQIQCHQEGTRLHQASKGPSRASWPL